MSNNNSQPMLWWLFDSENGSFSTLPTGPLLLPVFIILSTVWVLRHAIEKEITAETLAGELANTPYWQGQKQRYEELLQKSVETYHNLSLAEHAELKRLQNYLYNPHEKK